MSTYGCEDDVAQTAWTTQGRIRRLATFPHGKPWGEPYEAHAKPKPPPPKHVHVWALMPAKDGKVYAVCSCGAARAA